MEYINIKEKIHIIRELIDKNNYDAIIPELIIINGNIDNKHLNEQIKFLCSKHYEFQQKILFGSFVNSIDRETYLKEILYITDETEKFINTIEIPKTTLSLNTFSNETVINILNLFDKQSKEKNLSEEELADVLDTKVKLYDSIFKNFDKELETTYNKGLSGVLFDRIISFEQIQKLDYDLIQSMRNNKAYNSNDRSLIISGITLSSINRFDSPKIHLLIDYLTDFEEGVWQKALVGVILSLFRYDNRISLFPELERRLEELKTINVVQESIILIERILRYRTFSLKDTFLRNKNTFIKRIGSILGDKVVLTKNDLSEMKAITFQHPGTPEEEFMSKLISHVNLTEMEEQLSDNESISIGFHDFFNLMDIEKYLELYELNHLQLNLNSEIYKNPRNWFIAFEDTDNVRSILVNDFKSDEIQIADFIKSLKDFKGISDIDKNAIIINIASYSDEFIKMLSSLSYLENYYLSKDNISNLELSFTKIIRELYRFQQLSVTSQIKNVFEDKISIYKKSLLDKIADKSVSDKINAKLLYDQEDYKKSLEILNNISPSEQDMEVLELFVLNYINLEQDAAALPYLTVILNDFKTAPPDEILQATWYARAKRLYLRLHDNDNYEHCLNQERFLRESIFENSLSNDRFDAEKMEKGIFLLDCYFLMLVFEWNQHKDLIKSFDFLVKYFQVFYRIPHTDIILLKEEIENRRESLLTLFNIFVSEENEVQNLELILKHIRQTSNLHSNVFLTMLEEFCKISDSITNSDLQETLENYEAIKDKCSITFLNMEPVFKNIVNTEPSTVENVVVPFILENTDKIEVIFSIKDFFERKEEALFKNLFRDLIKRRKQLLFKEMNKNFLANIFSKQFRFFSETEILKKQLYYDILSATIPTENSTKADNT